MDDRSRAIAILEKARQILLERLVEEVVAAEEPILDEARGTLYGGDIERLYEQLGGRLINVNNMLATLQGAAATGQVPEVEEPLIVGPQLDVDHATVAHAEPPPRDDDSSGPSAPSGDETRRIAVASSRAANAGDTASPPSDWDAFLASLEQGSLDESARRIERFLAVDAGRARRAAEHFRRRLSQAPQFLESAMLLRREVEAGSTNAAIMLLWECFGLQGLESIAAAQLLKERLAGS